MLRAILIPVWLLALLFFIWEFAAAKSVPKRYSKLHPNVFRLADVLFVAAVVLTLYYLITDPS